MLENYNAIIVDDEESARNILASLLAKFCPQINIVATCKDLTCAVDEIKQHNPQLVFLDIEMPNYAGYEITSLFENINFEIIFVTAYDSYAKKAFELSAVDYLLKPINIERLKEAVHKFENNYQQKNAALNYQVLKESLKENSEKKIIAPYKSGQKAIAIQDIIAIEANESYSKVRTLDNQHYLFSKNLKHFENLFESNENFFRSHKSWIVNLDHIDHYSSQSLSLHLRNKVVAKLSKYKKKQFEDIMRG